MKVSALLIAGMAAVLVEASRLEHKGIAKVPTEGNHKPCNDGCGESTVSDSYEETGQQPSWDGRGAAGDSKMKNISSLIREACSLPRLDILTFILERAKPDEIDELDQILDSFWKLEMFRNERAREYYPEDKHIYHVLRMAARHGYVPIIRFLWPRMATMPNDAEMIIKVIMTETYRHNHRSVLEFFLWQSGEDYTKIAHKYVDDAFKAAIRKGNVDIIELLTGKNNDGTFVSPGLCLPTLNEQDFGNMIKFKENWNGIKYLVDLKKKGDSRFANFELFDQDNTALCLACGVGDYEGVKYLLDTTDDGKFVFPLTNPAARDNQPLVNACSGGNVQIVKKFLERDISGKYLYESIDPSAQNYQGLVYACRDGHMGVVQVLLEMEDGKYVLPGMEGVNLGRALLGAVEFGQIDVVEFLLKMKNGKYVLPEMNGVDLNCALSAAISAGSADVVELLLRKDSDGSYLYPGVKLTK